MGSLSINIPSSKLKALAKKKGVKKITSLSAAEFRELQSGGGGATKGKVKKVFDFSFSYTLSKIENGYILYVLGKHISKNAYDSLPFRGRLVYKNAFKNASRDLFLKNRSFFRDSSLFQMLQGHSKISFHFCCPGERDWDGNSENIKKIQDVVVGLGVVEDDAKKYLSLGEITSKVSKEYSMTVTIVGL